MFSSKNIQSITLTNKQNISLCDHNAPYVKLEYSDDLINWTYIDTDDINISTVGFTKAWDIAKLAPNHKYYGLYYIAQNNDQLLLEFKLHF